jgi:signal transduction histidine kinase
MTMSERAAAVDGRCRIESQPGQGTRVVVEVSR